MNDVAVAFSDVDHAHMARALQLAERARFSARPNPVVGCVIAHGERVVGEGFHIRAGGPHAEVHALRMAGERACGATAYVTLEPCSHYGRTPPCALALIQAGVARVMSSHSICATSVGSGVGSRGPGSAGVVPTGASSSTTIAVSSGSTGMAASDVVAALVDGVTLALGSGFSSPEQAVRSRSVSAPAVSFLMAPTVARGRFAAHPTRVPTSLS